VCVCVCVCVCVRVCVCGVGRGVDLASSSHCSRMLHPQHWSAVHGAHVLGGVVVVVVATHVPAPSQAPPLEQIAPAALNAYVQVAAPGPSCCTFRKRHDTRLAAVHRCGCRTGRYMSPSRHKCNQTQRHRGTAPSMKGRAGNCRHLRRTLLPQRDGRLGVQRKRHRRRGRGS
jgi:hypothetical protein